jgi:[ribosomal protein S5]-alanine N-acetyltransferase
MMIPSLETERMWARPVRLEDAEQVQKIFPQWEIVKHLGTVVPWPYPPDGALQFYREVAIPKMERAEAWHWTLRLKAVPERIVGALSLCVAGPEPIETNRGFWIAPEFQGRGLATEAAEAANAFWFGTLGFPVLHTIKALENVQSRRVSEKNGMRVVGIEERDFVCGRLPAEICEMTAEEWRARRQVR